MKILSSCSGPEDTDNTSPIKHVTPNCYHVVECIAVTLMALRMVAFQGWGVGVAQWA